MTKLTDIAVYLVDAVKHRKSAHDPLYLGKHVARRLELTSSEMETLLMAIVMEKAYGSDEEGVQGARDALERDSRDYRCIQEVLQH